MSGQISESKINEVRERTDIVELVSQYVDLKRSGANHMGLCPFHSEKSPSFSVHAGRQFYHCFGCGVGGDAFSFLQQIEGLTFPDAVRRLAERAGIELEERQLSPEEEQRQKHREQLFRVNELAAEYFHRLLMEEPAGEPCRQYLKRRGYGRKAAGEYQIGYATDVWEGLTTYLKEQGANLEDARTLGLIRESKQGRNDYDLFRGRLMFPIFDLQGRPVAFGGRVLDDSKPKYINSPESPIYHKGRVLFGLYQARQSMRQSGEVILVEGYFDQLALHRAGFQQVVATCGTALTAEHARMLKRYVQKAILLFDQDEAGKQATFKAMTALQDEGVPALVIELPKGDDPDSFVQTQGPDAFRQRLEQARPVMDLFMEDALQNAGAGVEQKVRAAESVIERIAELSSSMEQDLYLKELAGRSGIELELLKQKMVELQTRPKAAPERNDYLSEAPPQPYDYPPPEMSYGAPMPEARSVQPTAPEKIWSRAEEQALCLLLHNPDARSRIAAEGVETYFSAARAQQLAEQLLEELTADGAAPEAVVSKLAAELIPQVGPLAHKDPAEFAGDAELMLQQCRDSLVRELKRKEREEMLNQISQAEKSGQAVPEDLMDRFKKLK
ncbi:DNA primase [Malonomonas rubra DSM 5091]|uniref:DNA primase n=1 Tax=Malonomonas rubra DSM 5091 TaxID=1122189 RepID=A0A1M6F9C1_MALRU|nr:DNA primase [Malonomonas rubra]SHI94270.1 DNA primase [Malonomonas rubra DSM 5091]